MLQPAKSCVYVDNITSISSPFPKPAGREPRGKGDSGFSSFGVGLPRPFMLRSGGMANRWHLFMLLLGIGSV